MIATRASAYPNRFGYQSLMKVVRGFRMRGTAVPQAGPFGTVGVSRSNSRGLSASGRVEGRLA
jgi:hypothetical protein